MSHVVEMRTLRCDGYVKVSQVGTDQQARAISVGTH